MSHDPRRPHRQDTFDLRDQILTDATAAHQHHPQAGHHQQHGDQHEDEEHSILEDDSEAEDDQDEFMEDDDSSSLSIPNESIDFDLVYSLHTFVATVEGQANVVKGDSLFLMDDSNSYWWLVRVLKTQEVGYIPAENIETPFERLARLNKHRNVDLAAPLPEENPTGYQAPQIQPSNSRRRNISFRSSTMFHYPPAVWNEEEQEGWEEDDYEGFDTGLDHPLNDEDDWEDEAMDDEWDDVGMSGPAMGDSFANQQAQRPQDTPPLVLQQPPRPQQPANQTRAQPQPPQVQDPQQRSPQQQQQMQQQPGMQYSQQDPRSLQQQGSNQSLQHQNSNPSIHQQGSNASLRQQGSKERFSPSDPRSNNSPESVSPGPGGSPNNAGGVKVFDPDSLDANETRKISATPSVARDQPYTRSDASQAAATPGSGPLLPSAILAQQENERKRVREELEEETRKRKQREGAERSSSQQSNRSDASKGGGKLVKSSGKDVQSAKDKERAERERSEREADERDGGKKNRGVFGSLFKRKDKEKPSDKASGSSRRTDDDYSRGGSISASDEGGSGRSGYSTERPSQGQGGPGHGYRVQEIDMKEQAAYQQRYLQATKGSAPQPSFGLQSANTVLPGGNNGPGPKLSGNSMKTNTNMGPVSQFGERSNTLKPGSGSGNNMPIGSPGSSSGHQRPGSLILTAPGIGFEGGASVPELSVMRVFAGSNLSTEATFKTVLLNSSTTSSDLVKQAMQRFRVAAGEDADDYYLAVKTVEGSFAALQPHEKPLVVFEEMIEANARDETLPTVKRSSITSISSLSSNLSMHSAIRRLPMNDFTDDSAVKFYLNRRGVEGTEAEGQRAKHSLSGGDEFWPEGGRHESLLSMGTTTDEDAPTEGLSATANDRFTSPTARFALQLVIYPDDLPDGMVFDPHTEAIIPKSTLKDRTPSSSSASPGIPQTFRRKVFNFPKNTTVAEVIELGLERFGISEGVVDGGDEVEDKNVKRRSASRVRYCLSCLSENQEKELRPSSKVLDAFSRPPSFRVAEQRRSADGKRRSADATMLLGSIEDVHRDDPIFILRRAVAYPMNNAPRSKLSAPLDDIALRHSHLQAQRESITASETSTNKEDDNATSPATPRPGAVGASVTPRAPPAQLSRQEIIAAQRAASRANQRAIISAQSNPEQGVDILLPDKATIRSSRIGADDGFRYSYILPDGEKFDISQYMEEEWPDQHDSQKGQMAISGTRNDLLEGVLGRHGVAENGQQTIGEKIDRVLNKLKGNPNIVGSSGVRGISSIYSDKDVVIPPTRPQRAAERAPSRSGTPSDMGMASSKTTAQRSPSANEHRPNQASVHSIESSEMSAYESTTSTPNKLDYSLSKPKPNFDGTTDSPNRSMIDEGTEEDHYLPPASTRKRPLLVLKDHDFGLTRMMAVIEMNAAMRAPAPWQKQGSRSVGRQRLRRQHSLLSSENTVDDILFGPTMDMEELHPRVREVFEPVAKQLDALDKQIDELFLGTLRLSNRA